MNKYQCQKGSITINPNGAESHTAKVLIKRKFIHSAELTEALNKHKQVDNYSGTDFSCTNVILRLNLSQLQKSSLESQQFTFDDEII